MPFEPPSTLVVDHNMFKQSEPVGMKEWRGGCVPKEWLAVSSGPRRRILTQHAKYLSAWIYRHQGNRHGRVSFKVTLDDGLILVILGESAWGLPFVSAFPTASSPTSWTTQQPHQPPTSPPLIPMACQALAQNFAQKQLYS